MPYLSADEASSVELLFAEGISRLHLRKPNCKRDELEGLLDKISPVYYDRIILHDWSTLAEEGAPGGIHLDKKNPEVPLLHKGSISRPYHSLGETIGYKPVYDYVLPSPISQSISKGRYDSGFSLDRSRNAKSIINDKVAALGGICPRTITKLKGIPFGGVAVPRTLWGNDPSPLVADRLIKQFRRLQVWP